MRDLIKKMRNINHSSPKSISREVTIGLIITVILVSTVSFFIASEIARTKAEAHLNAKADEHIHYLEEILILPVWNYEYETIDVIGRSYLQNDDIASIEIVDSRGKKIDFGAKEDEVPLVTRTAKLTYYDQPIGSVQISLSSNFYNFWNRQIFYYFGLIILINLIFLILVSGLLLRWSLNKPLRLLNHVVESYDSRKKEFLPVQMPYTEFRPLIDTLHGMGNEIQRQMAELEKAEKKYRSIFENAVEGIFQSTLKGEVINANPAFARILGYENSEELMSQVVDIGSQHYVIPTQREEYIQRLERDKGVSSFEVQFRKKDGSIIWVSLNALPIYDANGNLKHIEGLVQDITKRKKAEIELTRLSTAVKQVAENIIITDDNGRIKYVNPAFERNHGYDIDNLFNKANRWLGANDSEKKIYDEMLSMVKQGHVWTGRLTSRKKNKDVVIEDAIVSPIKSPSGRFIGYVSINRDVTLKVKYENQLRQSQKMEAIGTLAGGIAHDFNNILGVIIGCSELVKKSLPQGHKAVQDIDQVLTAGLRAKSLVNQILTFSRREESRKTPLILPPFVKEVIKFLQATLPNYIKIRFTQRIKSAVVLADPIQMQQILMNLCTNSSQAIGPNPGVIEVVLSEEDYTSADGRPPDLPPGSYARLDIKDDGPGIAEEIQNKIFDPFFTTKGVGEGTGLGLSVVHGIVKKHEGTILVNSREGAGACFSILLPRIEHPDIKIKVNSESVLPQGTERILLVDDEQTLLDTLDRLLRSLGYDVEAYKNSSEALRAFFHKTDYFDLLVTDHVMPDMTGVELAGEIQRKNPVIPVILLTGFNEPLDGEPANSSLRIDKILNKPLMHAELAYAVRKVLNGKQPE
jgi:PAS domain S-box-containing protein